MNETEVERMVVRLLGDNSSLVAAIQESVREVEKGSADILKKVTEMEQRFKQTEVPVVGLSQALSGFGAVAVGVGASLTGVLGGMLTMGTMAAAAAEQNKVAFTTLTGSATEAEDILKRLTTFAAETPFEMPEIVQAARGLITFGERGKQLEHTLVLLGNASAATSARFGDIVTIINQIRGKGKLQMEEFYQLSERGVLSIKDLADHFQVADNVISDMISGGQVKFSDIMEIMEKLNAEGGRYNDAMKAQSKTLLGLFSTLKDSFSLLLREIASAFTPMVKDVVAYLIQLTDWIRNLSPTTIKLIGLVAGLGAAFGVVLTVLGSSLLLIGSLSAAYTSFTVAVGAATAAQLGFAAAGMAVQAATGAAALALIAYAGYTLYSNNEDILAYNAAIERHNELLKETQQIQTSKHQKTFDESSQLSGGDKQAFLSNATSKANQELADLNKMLAMAQANADKLEPSLLGVLFGGSYLYEQSLTSVDEYKDAIAEQTQYIRDLEAESKKLAETQAGIADPKAVEAGQKYIDSLRLQIMTMGWSSREAKLYELQLAGIPVEQLKIIEGLNKEAEAKEKLIEKQKEEQKERERLSADVEKLTESLRLQVATLGMSKDEATRYELAQRGANVEDLLAIATLQKKVEAHNNQQKAIKKSEEELSKLKQTAESMRQSLATPFEKFLGGLAEAKQLLDKKLIDEETFKRQTDKLQDDLLSKEFKANLKLQYKGIEGIDASSADALARVDEYRQQRSAQLQFDKKKQAAQAIIAGVAAADSTGVNLDPKQSFAKMEESLKQLVKLGEEARKDKPLTIAPASLSGS